jgi:hypothetical protein
MDQAIIVGNAARCTSGGFIPELELCERMVKTALIERRANGSAAASQWN